MVLVGLRVLELVAHRHTVAGPDELGQVVLEGVVRESGEFHLCGGAVLPSGEHDVQDLGRLHGILSERLIEIAHAEQQEGIGVLGLDLDCTGPSRGSPSPLRGFPCPWPRPWDQGGDLQLALVARIETLPRIFGGHAEFIHAFFARQFEHGVAQDSLADGAESTGAQACTPPPSPR